MGYVRELDDVLWGRRSLGMWMQDKVGEDWPYLLGRFGINYDELRHHALEGGAWSLGKDLQGRPLKVVCRYAFGESTEVEEVYPYLPKTPLTVEWIVGQPEHVQEHLDNWREAFEGKITAKEYQIRTGLLLGYDEEDTASFAERNAQGAICRCTQCIPDTATQEWWARVELKEVALCSRET